MNTGETLFSLEEHVQRFAGAVEDAEDDEDDDEAQRGIGPSKRRVSKSKVLAECYLEDASMMENSHWLCTDEVDLD